MKAFSISGYRTFQKCQWRWYFIAKAKSGADAAEGLKAIISLLVSSIVASTSGDSDHAGFQFDAGDIDSDLLTVWD